MKNKLLPVLLGSIVVVVAFCCTRETALAQPIIPIPDINLDIGTAEEPEQMVGTLKLLLLLAVLSLAPAFMVLVTSFTRIVIVLSFVRNALATQQIPPNQVIIGLALF